MEHVVQRGRGHERARSAAGRCCRERVVGDAIRVHARHPHSPARAVSQQLRHPHAGWDRRHHDARFLRLHRPSDVHVASQWQPDRRGHEESFRQRTDVQELRRHRRRSGRESVSVCRQRDDEGKRDWQRDGDKHARLQRVDARGQHRSRPGPGDRYRRLQGDQRRHRQHRERRCRRQYAHRPDGRERLGDRVGGEGGGRRRRLQRVSRSRSRFGR